MRPLILAFAIGVTVLVLGVGVTSVAFADAGPHSGNFTYTSGSNNAVRDSCASCHRAHTAKGSHLLTASSVQELCFTCHGGASATLNVWDGIEHPSSGSDEPLKGGGIVNARIDHAALATADPGGILTSGQAVKSAHVKFGTTGSMPGNGLTPQNVIWGSGAISSTSYAGKDLAAANLTSLSCADCHNPHGGADNGSATYRLLRPLPNKVEGSPTGVALPDEAVSPHEYVTTNYWRQYEVSGGSFVDTTVPWTGEQMSKWCSTCHTRYLAKPTDAYGATGSGDAIFNFRHQSGDSGTGTMGNQTGAPYGSATFTPFCLQCHVSHGSNATLATTRSSSSGNIPWPGSSTSRSAESTLLKVDNRGTCILCHGTSPGSYTSPRPG
ncbi:MAG: cytochrome c3 family protein [Chloroflexi bacterium]|nr:cytochrome c3 family protein [Chloroflexota bacterium]